MFGGMLFLIETACCSNMVSVYLLSNYPEAWTLAEWVFVVSREWNNSSTTICERYAFCVCVSDFDFSLQVCMECRLASRNYHRVPCRTELKTDTPYTQSKLRRKYRLGYPPPCMCCLLLLEFLWWMHRGAFPLPRPLCHSGSTRKRTRSLIVFASCILVPYSQKEKPILLQE